MEIAEEPTAERIPNRYSLVVLAAKRAKQIKEGAPPLIATDSTNSLTIALEEIAAGKINYIEAPEPIDDEKAHPVAVIAPAIAAPPTAMQILTESFAEAERAAILEDEEAAGDAAEDILLAEAVGEDTAVDLEEEQEYVGAAAAPAEEE
jgi:DNA-directed RNA polymerase subunit omega